MASGLIDRDLTGRVVEGVVGDASSKTIAHGLGVIPAFVILTPDNSTVLPRLVSKDATNVVVRGEAGTFDVLIVGSIS